MAEVKVHKKERPNKAEPTPQAKKARDLKASGFSLREIAEKFKITRNQVEKLLAVDDVTVVQATPAAPVAPVVTEAPKTSAGKAKKSVKGK